MKGTLLKAIFCEAVITQTTPCTYWSSCAIIVDDASLLHLEIWVVLFVLLTSIAS